MVTFCLLLCNLFTIMSFFFVFFFSSRRRHTRLTCDWSSDVCSSDLPGGADHAFVSTGAGMVDLNTLIPAGSGWVLNEARDINNSGQIVGGGIIGGQMHRTGEGRVGEKGRNGGGAEELKKKKRKRGSE